MNEIIVALATLFGVIVTLGAGFTCIIKLAKWADREPVRLSICNRCGSVQRDER